MNTPRRPIDLTALDLSEGWESLKGYPADLQVKLLSDDLDETTKTGARTRIVRFAPGFATSATLVHDYWEEVYLLEGDMQFDGEAGECGIQAPAYSCRPPGTPHGPYASRRGCLMLEWQYYRK
ncbi:cupin [Azospirillum sp. A29]|uniref:cupin domain-containing protein n=1 Tax=Azospirillum sp. A29 TaxID=3160606 RepID=UPI00366D281D